MSLEAEFAATALRLLAAMAVAGLSVRVLWRSLSRGGEASMGQARARWRRGARPPIGARPLPGREDEARLAAVLHAAGSRPHARDLAQARLRSLARDVAALRLGLDDQAARLLVESGAFPPDPGEADFLLRDWIAGRRGPEPDFAAETARLLDTLEQWTNYDEIAEVPGRALPEERDDGHSH